LFTKVHLILILLCLLSLAADAKPPLTMEVSAGLGGFYAANQSSEIKIELFSSSVLNAQLEIRDSTGQIIIPLQLDEYQKKILWLPVNPLPNKTIHIQLKSSTQTIFKKTLQFELSPEPLHIISSTLLPDNSLANIKPVILAATELPHQTQAYNSISAIISEQKILSALSPAQYHALSYYLGQCGILLLSTENPQLIKDLQSIAGCQGYFVRNYQQLAQTTALLSRLTAQSPPKLPGQQELSTLQKNTIKQKMTHSLTYYLSAYIFLMALLSWKIKKTVYLLFLPVITAAVGILIWTGATSHQLISWTETQSGSHYSKSSALLLLGGERLGSGKITIGIENTISNPQPYRQIPEIQYDLKNKQQSLQIISPLLHTQSYLLSSVNTLSAAFTIELIEQTPLVKCQTDNFPANSRLLWRGQIYTIPELAKEQSWQPDPAQGYYPSSAEERLLSRRLAFNATAILIPKENNSQSISWLVIRTAARELL